jgi:hypothetical protein
MEMWMRPEQKSLTGIERSRESGEETRGALRLETADAAGAASLWGYTVVPTFCYDFELHI